MNRFRQAWAAAALLAAFVFSGAIIADAQQANSRAVRDAVRSLNSKLEDFEYNLREQMRSSSANNADLSNVSDDIRALRDATYQFENNLDQRRENRDDVNKMIDAARRVDQFLKAYPQNRLVTDAWAGVRTQVDRLGANYGVTAKWDSGDADDPSWVADDNDDVGGGYPSVVTPSPNVNSNTIRVGLSGSYDLDSARSESVDDIITDASLSNSDREDIKDKLVAPQHISIEIRGNQVTLGTSNAAPVTIAADGRDHIERLNGKSVRLRATLSGDTLTLSSLGGETDYVIVFTSVSNGRALKVSRRITTDYLSETVMAESVYNKTSSTVEDRSGGNMSTTGGGGSNMPSTGSSSDSYDPNGGYSDNDQPKTRPGQSGTYSGRPSVTTARTGNFGVPGGVILTGILENEIRTGISQNNDRFRMTVQSPMEFRGAVIEGYISGVSRSGRITGASNVAFNFERITLRTGQTYDFAGNLQSIRDHRGKSVQVDSEGTVRSGSQTTKTIKRAGIGAGIGAIIGAIAGGGSGAAIGAAIGGGGGAGSVYAQGKEDIRLMPGTTITVQSASPPR